MRASSKASTYMCIATVPACILCPRAWLIRRYGLLGLLACLFAWLYACVICLLAGSLAGLLLLAKLLCLVACLVAVPIGLACFADITCCRCYACYSCLSAGLFVCFL